MAVGMDRNVTGGLALWAMSLEALGDVAGAEARHREGLVVAHRVGQNLATINTLMHMAVYLAGQAEGALREEALSLLAGWELERLPLYAGMAHLTRARVAWAVGDLPEAEEQARKACARMELFLVYQRPARRLLSQVLLARGRPGEARQEAELGVRRLEQCGGQGYESVALWLALAEACFAEGDTPAAEAALRQALRCVHTRAEDIPDVAARECFLRQVPENARTLALAHQRWGQSEVP
jgi:tetratricopeptide (TPR) repeat protein